MAQSILPEEFYTANSRDACVQSYEGDCFIYKMENETGEGMMTQRLVFPGIEILYNDFHLTTVHPNQSKRPYQDIMEINHCREGRFECEFSDSSAVYLGSGDLAVNMLTHPTRDSWFPLSHYHGISVIVDLRTAQDTLHQIGNALDSQPIDLFALRDRLCGNDTCFIIRATEAIQHIFSELYAMPLANCRDYCKIKVLELLLFLDAAGLPFLREKRAYISRTQSDTIRAIRTYLMDRLDQHITLTELSQRFHIPLTTMKQHFKTIYGDSIGVYMHSYRMQKAMWLLLETDDSITDIAGQVGYQNASKFSDAFHQFTGVTPSEYRKTSRPIGVESVHLE